MSARPRLRVAGRLAALAATTLALLATTVPPCVTEDRGTFDAVTTCGPPGVVTLAYVDASSACDGNDCWGFVQAPGANASGLPEQGEIHPEPDSRQEGYEAPAILGMAFARFPFALVGDAPVAGAVPPARVRRICRASPGATSGVVDVACSGDAPGAACSGTLTLRPPSP